MVEEGEKGGGGVRGEARGMLGSKLNVSSPAEVKTKKTPPRARVDLRGVGRVLPPVGGLVRIAQQPQKPQAHRSSFFLFPSEAPKMVSASLRVSLEKPKRGAQKNKTYTGLAGRARIAGQPDLCKDLHTKLVQTWSPFKGSAFKMPEAKVAAFLLLAQPWEESDLWVLGLELAFCFGFGRCSFLPGL